MAKKPKVEINRPQTGLNAAFSNLDLSGLPAGEIREAEPAPSKTKSLGRVLLRKETAHRGGKVVIVVHDFESHITAARIEEICRELKQACGTGGTAKDRTIEIQGEQTAKIRSFLEQLGFRVGGVR